MLKYRFFTLLIAFGILITSCDKIEPPFRENQGGGNTETETRKVLLEDYTGHTCVNCPAAAKAALELQNAYSGKMIIMAIHSGFFARPSAAPFNNDYRTPEGDAWDQFFAVSAVGNPNGLVNRINENGNYVVTPGNWSSSIAAIIEDLADLKISVETTYNADNRNLAINVNGSFLNSLQGDYKLITCIVEDSIISAQKNNDPAAGETPVIAEYVHRHMLREVVNSIWGEEVVSNPTASSTFDKNYTLMLDPKYKQQHVSVIAFVYDASSFEIIQVEEHHIQ